MASYGEDVYCTLLMSDSYLPGAVVLAHSLRDAGTKKKLAILVTLDSILHTTITELKTLYDFIITVDKIANPNLENLHKLDRLDLRFAFTKIALWRQQQFRKIVYLDCDVVALRAPDELFDIDAPFAAAPDIGWPDIFNTGVMMLKPSMSEYWSLQSLAASGTSFDGADQGLLNEYFSHRPWHRLSFTYNCTPSSSYQYEPAYRHFRSSINLVHFIGKDKPWNQGRKALSANGPGVYKELLGRWWSVYDRHYRDFVPSVVGHGTPPYLAVRRFVTDEESSSAFAWASVGYPLEPKADSAPEQAIFVAPPSEETGPESEEPKVELEERYQPVDRGQAAVQQFIAPQTDWDATRSEPPAESKPEAQNFPTTHYEMSRDPHLFQAPRSYPEPPRDMYYSVPETKPAVYEKPKPIFPWEQSATTRKPARVFPEDQFKEPEQPSAAPQGDLDREEKAPETEASPTTPTPTIKVTSADLWDAYSKKNAWDDISAIDRYVRALKQSQTRKGPIQVLHNTVDVTSPTEPTTPPQRRESLILTDFPTEIERPSLPVTPAPIRKSSFWGEERDDEALPPAEGVPEQADWNPVEKLEALRRASLIAPAELPNLPQRDIPMREMPGSIATMLQPAVNIGESSATGSSLGGETASQIDTSAPLRQGEIPGNSTTAATTVMFREPVYSSGNNDDPASTSPEADSTGKEDDNIRAGEYSIA